MEKRGIILIIVILSLALAGCSGGAIKDFDPYKGTRGVRMDFIDNAPPREFFEGQEVPIGIEMKNEGAHDIGDGLLSITVEDAYIEKPFHGSYGFTLEGKSRYSPDGKRDEWMFYSTTKELEEMSSIHSSKILTSICYEYGTHLDTEVCIDPDVYNLKDIDKPCTVKDQSFSGQGAPVAITRIEQTMSKDEEGNIKPVFEIYIRNKGRGRIIDDNSLKAFCGDGEMREEYFNTVDITGKIAGKRMDCQPQRIKVRDEGRARCKPKEALEKRDTSYITSINLDLSYGYTISDSKEIKILANENENFK
ncbi:MAG: hypothetical protein ACQEP1_02115 [Nanobdellota archaeon]